MSEFDVILEYVNSDDVITLVSANNMVGAAKLALEDAIYFKDAKYISMMEIKPNNDKVNICKH
jgi:hypothetical protein